MLTWQWNNLVVWPTVAKCSESAKPHHGRPHYKTVSPSYQHGNIAVTFYYRRVKRWIWQTMKPLVIGDYNTHMGYMDKSGQICRKRSCTIVLGEKGSGLLPVHGPVIPNSVSLVMAHLDRKGRKLQSSCTAEVLGLPWAVRSWWR
jgi:hypothetical protein